MRIISRISVGVERAIIVLTTVIAGMLGVALFFILGCFLTLWLIDRFG